MEGPSTIGDAKVGGDTVERLNKIVGMTFASVEEAWEFYEEHANQNGFSVRRGTTRVKNENKYQQEFCCSKQGQRKSKVDEAKRSHAPRAETRSGCKARVVVPANAEASDRWVITLYDNEHNHELCPPSVEPFFRSHRDVTDADIIEASAYQNVGVGTSKIMKFFMQQSDVYQTICFTKKDLYNVLQKIKANEVIDGDVNVVLGYFDLKKEIDLDFFMKITVDNSNCLRNLFWADSTSRANYVIFGDAIAFDTTYKDETADTFEWVLDTFAEAMLKKSPLLVVTVGDKAIQRAIKNVFPNAKHRICSWHLARNAKTSIGVEILQRNLADVCMLGGHLRNLMNNERQLLRSLIWKTISGCWRIALWAQAYLTGHFFVKMRSTQRCESMNVSLFIFLKCKKTYLEFIRVIEDAICQIRLEKLQSNYGCTQSKSVMLSQLKELEGHAAEVYTRKSYRNFREELIRETLYIVSRHEDDDNDASHIYLTKYRKPGKEYEVQFDVVTKTLTCCCRKFETFGFPCRHQLHVLKIMDRTRISNSFILNRWKKMQRLMPHHLLTSMFLLKRNAWLDSLIFDRIANKLFHYASNKEESYRRPKDEIHRLAIEMEASSMLNDSHVQTTPLK